MLPPLTIDNPPVVVDTSVSVMPNINSKASNQNHSIAHNSSTEALNGLKQDTTQYAPGINKARHGSLFKAIPVLLGQICLSNKNIDLYSNIVFIS